MLRRAYLVPILFMLVACANTTSSQPGADDWVNRSAHEQATAIADGQLTSEALVRAYLARIKQLDGKVNSVLALNPDALSEAKEKDAALARGEKPGPLFGLPVLLKDNIESRELPTTAGSMALMENETKRDAPLVRQLRDAGAIILGKTNLSEWANFRSESSISGWSAVGGLTHNPYLLARTACGSSSGSGAAMALRLASLAVGTETNGSIICPSSMNGVVGFKPTVGLISRSYIVPISFTQDTAGPMAATVKDAALMAKVMAGKDEKDDATMVNDRPATLDLAPASLDGVRVGVMRFRQGDNPHILEAFNNALAQMEKAGAVLIDIDDFDQPESFWPDSYQVLLSEFKYSLNAYLADSPAPISARSLNDLIAFNASHEREMMLFDQSIFTQSEETEGIDSELYKTALSQVRDAAGKNGLDKLLSDNNIDIIVSPSNSPAFLIDAVYGDHAPTGFIGVGYLAAIAGYPHLTVPMGMVKGLPVGLSFIGGKWQDAKVLAIGEAYEGLRPAIPAPGVFDSILSTPELAPAFKPLSTAK